MTTLYEMVCSLGHSPLTDDEDLNTIIVAQRPWTHLSPCKRIHPDDLPDRTYIEDGVCYEYFLEVDIIQTLWEDMIELTDPKWRDNEIFIKILHFAVYDA